MFSAQAEPMPSTALTIRFLVAHIRESLRHSEGAMGLHRTLLPMGLFAFGLVVSSAPIAKAQNVTPRITEVVDNQKRVTLRGNTYPLARPEYDRGAAPDSLPMER